VSPINWESVARQVLHPLQAQVLERAAGTPDERVSPRDLAEEFGVPLPNLAYHVRVLVDHGFLKKAGTAPRRGAVQHYYKVSPKLLV
jgi:DNA-binding transcriptional ArsR family regulator